MHNLLQLGLVEQKSEMLRTECENHDLCFVDAFNVFKSRRGMHEWFHVWIVQHPSWHCLVLQQRAQSREHHKCQQQRPDGPPELRLKRGLRLRACTH